MKDSKPNTKNIAVDLFTHEKIKVLAKKNGESMGQFLSLCVDFFERTGLSPRDGASMVVEDIKYIKQTVTRIQEGMQASEKKK